MAKNPIILDKPYSPKTPYIDGFDAACWLGRYWDRHKESMDPITCHPKYKQGTTEWDQWHEGYADGLDELGEFKEDILRADPPEHQFVERNQPQADAEIASEGDDDE